MHTKVKTTAAAGSVLYRSPGHHYPLAVSSRGMRITDSNGRAYLDMSGGAAVSCLGHAHPQVIEAMTRQLERLAFAHTAFFTNEPQERLAAAIAARFAEPGARVYFTSGGSEANEAALKLAWQYWAARGKPAKQIIISREHSYHGNTFGVLSASGNAGRRRASAAPLIEWPRVPPCYEFRERRPGESADAYAMRAANSVEAAIEAAGADNVAAFICEPVVGSSLGVVAAVAGYLQRVREICDRHQVLLISDEIMCGSGRTGYYFAHEHDRVLPDIVTLAKGIAAGYMPLGAALVRADIVDALGRTGFVHGHTYIGHPLACAAGAAVIDTLECDALLQRTEQMGKRLLAALCDAFGEHPHVGDIRGRGLFAALELAADRATKAGFANAPALSDQLRAASLEAGLIVYPGSITVDGLTVPHIMLAPPMIVEDRHFDECIAKLRTVIDGVLPA